MFTVVDAPDSALAAVLRRLREERGLAQEELAFQAGISTNSVSRIERELNSPLWVTVRRLADALEVDLADLVAEVGRERDP